MISTGPEREQTIVLRHPFGAETPDAHRPGARDRTGAAARAGGRSCCCRACWRPAAGACTPTPGTSRSTWRRASSSSTAAITSTTPSIRRSARVLLALGPWLAGAHSYGTPPPDGTHEGKDILYSGGHYGRYLTLARARHAAVPGAAAPGHLAVGAAAVRLPGARAAGGAAARLGAAGARATRRWRASTWRPRRPSCSRSIRCSAGSVSADCTDALLFGLATGLAVAPSSPQSRSSVSRSCPGARCTSWSTRPAAAAAGAHRRRTAASACCVARGSGAQHRGRRGLVPLLARYGPRAPNEARVAIASTGRSLPAQQGGFDHALGVLLSHVWLPRELKDLVNGVVAVKAHNDSGHLSYLHGRGERDRLVVLLPRGARGEDAVAAARGRTSRCCVAGAHGLAGEGLMGAGAAGVGARRCSASRAPSAASTSASATY